MSGSNRCSNIQENGNKQTNEKLELRKKKTIENIEIRIIDKDKSIIQEKKYFVFDHIVYF